MFVLLTWPSLAATTAGLRVRMAADEAAAVLRRAKMAAIERRAHVAVRFTRDERERLLWTLYLDGDGDGVLSRDIRRGVDRPLGRPRALRRVGSSVRPGFPPGPPPRDPGDRRRRMRRLGDPLRFNRSDMASFGPLGTSTPGSLYLTDGRSALAAVRVLGRTGKIRITVYDAATETWR